MATTFIDTSKCERIRLPGGRGDVAEIVNGKLCKAKDVLAALRWLNAGDRFEAEPLKDTHQLVYLMDGRGVISLAGKDYDVARAPACISAPRRVPPSVRRKVLRSSCCILSCRTFRRDGTARGRFQFSYAAWLLVGLLALLALIFANTMGRTTINSARTRIVMASGLFV